MHADAAGTQVARASIMRTTHSIAVTVAMMLAAACGHEDEPSKTAYQVAPTPSPVQVAPPAPATPAAATPVAGPTSADVPREGPSAGSAEAQPVTPLTDGQILQITHTANAAEIAQAKIALSKTRDARVRSLAQMMVRDHSQADSKGMVLAKKENLDREPSPTNDSLESDAEGATRTLKAEMAADFDKDYVDTQIKEHQAALDVIDQKLVVGATNANLKAYLTEVRAAVASHLQHAQDLQKSMQK
jgi:putative membrane protein